MKAKVEENKAALKKKKTASVSKKSAVKEAEDSRQGTFDFDKAPASASKGAEALKNRVQANRASRQTRKKLTKTEQRAQKAAYRKKVREEYRKAADEADAIKKKLYSASSDIEKETLRKQEKLADIRATYYDFILQKAHDGPVTPADEARALKRAKMLADFPYSNVSVSDEEIANSFNEGSKKNSSEAVEAKESVRQRTKEEGEGPTSTAEEVREALRFDKAVGDDFTKMEDRGDIVIVENESDLPSNLQGVPKSQINKKTGNVVPDALANENNPNGVVATVDFGGKRGFPSREVVVKPGKQGKSVHSGVGAKHLTSNAITGRTNYPELENKTEASLLDVVDTLRTCSEVYRINDGGKYETFVFYSRKKYAALITYYEDGKFVSDGQFYVVTNRPSAKKPTSMWGTESVNASVAVRVPDTSDSASLAPWSESSGDKPKPDSPRRSGNVYTPVDYTKEVLKGQAEIKRSADDAIQAVYDPGNN